MKAFLIRHAESSGQPPEAPLTDRGTAQAQALVPVLASLGAGPLFASPYRRAMDTLAPYAQSIGQRITPLDTLRERLLSPVPLEDWKDHIRRSFDAPDHAPDGGESHSELLGRWALALSDITAAEGRPAFATHGGMTAALFHALDPGFGFDGWASLRNPDVFEITLEDGNLTAFTRIDLEEE